METYLTSNELSTFTFVTLPEPLKHESVASFPNEKNGFVLFGVIPYCSVLDAMGGVAAPSPRLDFAASQMWYKVLGYSPSRTYSLLTGRLLWFSC